MTTFAFSGQGAAIPYSEPGAAILRKRINVPDLITYGGLDSAVPAAGFGAADILQVFNVPAGFVARSAGIRLVTAEGAACTVDLGVSTAAQIHPTGADANGLLDDVDLNATAGAVEITSVADTMGANTLMGVVFVTDGTIDLLFNSATTNLTVFDIWVDGFMAF